MWIAGTIVLGIVGAFLNRLRGGWLKDLLNTNSTIACRLTWAIPTGILLFVLTTPDTQFWYRALFLVLSSYLAWSMWGSGAHSIMSKDAWINVWKTGNTPDVTENYTSWWLPQLITPPNANSPVTAFWIYHTIGKSAEGVIRMLTTTLPILVLSPVEAGLIVASGLLWGPIFLVSWWITDTKGWVYGEWGTGFLTWLTIVGVFLL